MKREHALVAVITAGLVIWALIVGLSYVQASAPSGQGAAPASPMGTGFTYQGRLEGGSGPVNDDCDLAFRLYDQAAEGSQVGEALSMTVPITDGLFTVNLDFGSGVFLGEARWLGIRVRCSGDPFYTSLGRQELTATPYALYAGRAYEAETLDGKGGDFYRDWNNLVNVPPGFADGTDADTTYGAGNQLALSAGQYDVEEGSGSGLDADLLDGQNGAYYRDWNHLTGVPSGFADGIDDDTTYGAGNQLTLSGGQYHVQEGSGSGLDADLLDGNDAADFWQTGGNAGTTAGPDFLGTTDGQPLVLKTNGAEAMRITAAGDVGIGTGNPSAALDVAGTVRAGDVECTDCIDGGDIDPAQVQARVTGFCSVGSAIRAIDSAGGVTCETDDTGLETCAECDSTFVNEGQADSVSAAMVAFNYAGSTGEGGPALNLTCAGCVDPAEVGFNYAGSSTKGGMATNSDQVDGLDIVRFDGRTDFVVVQGSGLRISVDGNKHVIFENIGTTNSHYWYAVDNGTPTAAYQSVGTSHDAGAVPWNGVMEFFYIVTRTGSGNTEFFSGMIFNDGINSANNWYRGYAITGN
jgi:hypothetical protein